MPVAGAQAQAESSTRSATATSSTCSAGRPPDAGDQRRVRPGGRRSSAPRRWTATRPHVSYAYNPTMDFPDAGTAAGHAYWVSGAGAARLVRERAAGDDRRPLRGLRSRRPNAVRAGHGSGVLTGGQFPALPMRARPRPGARRPRLPWPTGSTSTRQHLDRDDRRRRARVNCNAQLDITATDRSTSTSRTAATPGRKAATPALRAADDRLSSPARAPNRTARRAAAPRLVLPPQQARTS